MNQKLVSVFTIRIQMKNEMDAVTRDRYGRCDQKHHDYPQQQQQHHHHHQLQQKQQQQQQQQQHQQHHHISI